MGRLFWRILLVFWAVLLILGLGIGYGVHLYFQSLHKTPRVIAEGPRAEILVQLSDGVIEGSQREEAVRTFGHWALEPGPLPLIVDAYGVDLLDRLVEHEAYAEARRLIEREGERSVREAHSADGTRWLIYMPAPHDISISELDDRPSLDRSNGPSPFGEGRFAHFELWTPLFAMLPAIITSFAVSAWLARSLSRRVRTLREGFEAVAAGDFATQLTSRMKGRDEIAELGRDFDSMAERLQNLVGAQRRLLNDVSHELRSPLARLQVAIGLARQQPERAAEVLGRVERESQRLDSLVGELLTLSRLESGSGVTLEDHVDLIELLRAVTDDAGFESAPAGVTVEFSGDTEQELILRAHGELLHRAFDNVVRNAVRYSRRGGNVEVRVRRTPAAVEVRVADRGPGVPESEIQSVFDAFVRGSESQGYGLGLAIARRSVEAHGGQIAAANRDGGGLEICITLPRP